MASTYTGNPANAAAPQAAPSLTTDVEVVQPADGDAMNAASVAQAPQGLADFMAYLRERIRSDYFGSGDAGDVDVSPAGILSLAGEVHYDTLTLLSAATLRTNGWPVICRTAFVMTGNTNTVTGNAGSASTSTSGTYAATAGGPHGSVAPSNGSSALYAYTGIDVYGLGGDGGIGGGSAPTYTRVMSPGSAYKMSPYRTAMGGDVGLRGATNSAFPGTRVDSIRGGGAGSCGGFVSGGTGGGAGAGGPLIVIMAPTITLNGFLTSNGGNGGAGVAVDGNGGGGGGGGAFLLVCQTLIDNGVTYAANAGTGGLGVGGGAAGSNGTAGNTTPYIVYVP